MIKNRIEKNRPGFKNNPIRKVRENNIKINIRNSLASRFKLFLLSQMLILERKPNFLFPAFSNSLLSYILKILLIMFLFLSIIKIAKDPNIYKNPSPINIDIIIDTLIYNLLFYLNYYLKAKFLLTFYYKY